MGILFLIALIIFKIAFFKEGFVFLLRTILSLFWLFALPGYFMMFYWKEKMGFSERFAIGIALSAGVIGISSYYLGFAGFNIKYHNIFLPAVLIIVGIIINLRK